MDNKEKSSDLKDYSTVEKMTIYSITGNHDYWYPEREVEKLKEKLEQALHDLTVESVGRELAEKHNERTELESEKNKELIKDIQWVLFDCHENKMTPENWNRFVDLRNKYAGQVLSKNKELIEKLKGE